MRHVGRDWFRREFPSGLEIGARTVLTSSYSFLHSAPSAKIQIGSDTGIYQGTFFEVGAAAHVTIGDYCTLVGAILRVESELRIGSYVLMAHDVVITDCETASSERPVVARPITIGDDVWVGLRAVILSGVIIGRGAVVGAGAIVNQDIPPGAIVVGNPARIVRMMDI